MFTDALRRGSAEALVVRGMRPLESKLGSKGLRTVLKTQMRGEWTYLDAGDFHGRTAGLEEN
jgi:hypothetical protein